MKVVKGLAIFSFFSIVFGSCFDPPEFPDVPEIQYADIIFRDNPNDSDPDSLILYITFKDGDGDLGLDPTDPRHLVPPFHNANYFQTDGSGGLIPVGFALGITGSAQQPTFINILDIENPALGKLAFPRTASNPAYSDLPGYSCVDYDYRQFILAASDASVLDEYSTIEDTLNTQDGQFILVSDSLYMQSNPNHYNIEVDFWIKYDPNVQTPPPGARVENGYYEFDWRREYCSTFDGRFPVLSDNEGAALDGTLKYEMESRGFKILFNQKTLKLRVQIKDRKLNLSNVVETEDFTLESIRG